MYPHLVTIGSFEITSFGLMVALGVVVGLWVFGRETRRSGLPERVVDAAAIGVFGGLVGAKVLWTIEHADSGPIADLLFSRGGLSWYGGFLGGVGAGLGYVRMQGWPVMTVLAAATPALAFGQLLGRIGCFLVGDDYGWPSSLPWAVAFPEGLPPTDVPVHPTQLYEAIGLAAVGAVLIRWRQAGVADRAVIARYLMLVGALRFAIEFVRVHTPIALGLAPAHWISLAAIAAGLLMQASGGHQPAAPVAARRRR